MCKISAKNFFLCWSFLFGACNSSTDFEFIRKVASKITHCKELGKLASKASWNNELMPLRANLLIILLQWERLLCLKHLYMLEFIRKLPRTEALASVSNLGSEVIINTCSFLRHSKIITQSLGLKSILWHVRNGSSPANCCDYIHSINASTCLSSYNCFLSLLPSKFNRLCVYDDVMTIIIM